MGADRACGIAEFNVDPSEYHYQDRGAMMKEEMIRLLRSSVPEWNAWRREHMHVQLDLSDTHFVETDLSGADLSRAIFNNAYLIKADLTGANLPHADFERTREPLIKAEVPLWRVKWVVFRRFSTMPPFAVAVLRGVY